MLKKINERFDRGFPRVFCTLSSGHELASDASKKKVKQFYQKEIEELLESLRMKECRLNGEMVDEGFSEDFERGMEIGFNQAAENNNAKIEEAKK